MKQRINITIEEELLDALREIVKQNDTNISQCVTDMILSSSEMDRYELQKLLERDGHLCSCCCKKFDLKGEHEDALPYVTKIDADGDKMLSNKQLICTECRDKKIAEKFNSIQGHFKALEEKRQLLETLKNKRQQMDVEIDSALNEFDEDDFDKMHNRPTKIDMVWFNGWMKNTCAAAKRGIIPFSDRETILRFKSEDQFNMPVMYDDKDSKDCPYIDNTIMYPIVIDYCVDEDHHDIVDTFIQCYGSLSECGVEAYVVIDQDTDLEPEQENEPYIYVRFRDSICEYFIYNDGDWCMS